MSLYEKYGIREAVGIEEERIPKPDRTGRIRQLERSPFFSPENPPQQNTDYINREIDKLSAEGGGILKFPHGVFRVYTIVLKSGVFLWMQEDTILCAAIPSCDRKYETQCGDFDYSYRHREGEGGNYLEPEVNVYIGIQDHGHSYFANSLIYAEGASQIGIIGGKIFGFRRDPLSGKKLCVLFGEDPAFPKDRTKPGHNGFWYGNKAIALHNCKEVLLRDLTVVMGGHFAVLATDVEDMLITHLLLDTNRDALNIDRCRNVTIRKTICNSLTDDGIVLKSSFAGGVFRPVENVLIEDCRVCGYDAGSVFEGATGREKQVAEDLCGPTGRIKLGTESTCGYERVTVRRTVFERSRGFALEAVDGSPLKDIIFEDCVMQEVSSSPVFIKAGDRGRFPVTGRGTSMTFPAEDDVRLQQKEWVLPNCPEMQKFPAKRFTPAWNRSCRVTVDGEHFFTVIDPQMPALVNEKNLMRAENGKEYVIRYEDGKYVPDMERGEVAPDQRCRYANASGAPKLAQVSNVLIRNIKVTGADPRYPLLLMGMTDAPLRNIYIENADITFQGGLCMEDAVWQKQQFREVTYAQSGTETFTQQVPVGVNPFFLKHEGLLPRKSYDRQQQIFTEDPYNIPELHEVYPEPSNWGILPAFGLYARHIRGLVVKEVCIRTEQYDGRAAIVLDDASEVVLENVSVINRDNAQETKAEVVAVEQHYKRHTNYEYLPGEPYFATGVSALTVRGDAEQVVTERNVITAVVDAPAPGTPPDALFPYPTVCEEVRYS